MAIATVLQESWVCSAGGMGGGTEEQVELSLATRKVTTQKHTKCHVTVVPLLFHIQV